MRIRGVMIGILMLLWPAVGRAEIRPHALFRDNAVFQRDARIPVFGDTDRTEPVTVRFAGQEVSCQPENGKWRVELSPLELCREGRALQIIQGKQVLEVKNLLVGDVWLCGGQSNMFVPLRDTDGAHEAIAKSHNDQLRLFFINPMPVDQDHPKEPREWTDGEWKPAAPVPAESFTAVGYHFGRELQKDLQIPIGLIESCLGGTTAERWISRACLESDPELRDSTESLKYDLYNGMIAPLTQYPIRGVIWYQGESNSPRSWKYRRLLPAMIRCWRDAWNLGDFPFLVVQLPGYEKVADGPSDSDWAEMREAQLYVSQNVPNVGLAVTIDLGDANEIHPRRKREVGERLALAAFSLAYHKPVVASGPTYRSVAFADGKARITLQNLGRGLEARDEHGHRLEGGELKGFDIAGADRKFYRATARIEQDKVLVWSPEVKQPVAVRYGWAKNPVVNLWNQDGLPASPFRTDDFPLTTRDNK